MLVSVKSELFKLRSGNKVVFSKNREFFYEIKCFSRFSRQASVGGRSLKSWGSNGSLNSCVSGLSSPEKKLPSKRAARSVEEEESVNDAASQKSGDSNEIGDDAVDESCCCFVCLLFVEFCV